GDIRIVSPNARQLDGIISGNISGSASRRPRDAYGRTLHYSSEGSGGWSRDGENGALAVAALGGGNTRYHEQSVSLRSACGKQAARPDDGDPGADHLAPRHCRVSHLR